MQGGKMHPLTDSLAFPSFAAPYGQKQSKCPRNARDGSQRAVPRPVWQRNRGGNAIPCKNSGHQDNPNGNYARNSRQAILRDKNQPHYGGDLE